ncbi:MULTISPECIES: hypothetical protein [Pseudomonas]|uniref:hypothetical protein n=1 Tax=Pseudomonas sp. NFX71 TaxID=3399121 RepID=UPI002ABA61CC|nr:hypothetical protein [Pseudomonas sp.]
MTRNRAPNLSSVRCCGALETWPRSQYSPRPPESALKKSPDLIPDQKANLSRPWTVTRHSNPPLNRRLLSRRTGVFLLFESLGAALANSTEANRLDDFLPLQKKAPHQSVDLKKTTWNTYFLGATE